jgi:DNA-binding CsgD family transcriptional regulator
MVRPGPKRSSRPEAEELSALIGDIYDAALDPALWPPALEKICAFVPGSMANIFSQDAVNKTANRYFTWGHDPYYISLYLEKYTTLNPIFPAALFFPVGEVYGSADIISRAEIRETRYYKEWLEPQGYIDFVGCNLDKTATSAAPIAVVRHQRDGFVDDETRRRMRLIAPHVRRAILIGKVINLNKVEAAALADALDGLTAAMFLVDADARIVHANASGLAMLAEGAVMRAAAGRVVANDPQTNVALRDILTGAAAGDIAIGVKGIAVPLPASTGMDHVAHVLPLTSAARRQAGISYAAAAAIFVHKSALGLQSPLEVLSRRYGLTAGELRVLLALVKGGSVAEVAQSLGITEGTVRNHLHQLFKKTDTSRQSELIKLTAGAASPLFT